jgi:hypothetical protein
LAVGRSVAVVLVGSVQVAQAVQGERARALVARVLLRRIHRRMPRAATQLCCQPRAQTRGE